MISTTSAGTMIFVSPTTHVGVSIKWMLRKLMVGCRSPKLAGICAGIRILGQMLTMFATSTTCRCQSGFNCAHDLLSYHSTHIFQFASVGCSASPDNLVWIGKNNGANSIVVAEDTSNHQNDFAWLIDLNTGERTRILTSVYGAEVTGVRPPKLLCIVFPCVFHFFI